jgi:hypothetical protein
MVIKVLIRPSVLTAAYQRRPVSLDLFDNVGLIQAAKTPDEKAVTFLQSR